MTGNDDYGIQTSGYSIIDYNDLWNNQLDYSNCSAGSNDISENPLFINENLGNFKLLLNSPCIDSGDPDIKYNDVDGTRNDIGAYGGPDSDLNWILTQSTALTIDSVETLNQDTINVKIFGSSLQGIANINITLFV